MTRPTRNLVLLIAASTIFGVSLGRASSWVGTALLVSLLALFVVFGRQHFVGRRRLAQKRWRDAEAAFTEFEASGRAAFPLFFSLYTSDGVALTRNNRAVARTHTGQWLEAESDLRFAIARDPLYAVPHVNLAILAAQRGDATMAEAERLEAARLGFRPKGLQQHLRALLAKTTLALAATVDSPPTA